MVQEDYSLVLVLGHCSLMLELEQEHYNLVQEGYSLVQEDYSLVLVLEHCNLMLVLEREHCNLVQEGYSLVLVL